MQNIPTDTPLAPKCYQNEQRIMCVCVSV
uniref:Uncharacterized protein n=1 Tax=Anopheles albimanus TaxID=7167 RepID=A0A182FZ32_ANOAL